MEQNNINERRAYIQEDELILEKRTDDSHSLSDEELKELLEARKKALREQLEALVNEQTTLEKLQEDNNSRHMGR